MRRWLAVLAVPLSLGVTSAQAQSVPRIKATVVSFADQMLTVRPAGGKNVMKIAVRPATRILKESTRHFSDIKVGDFIGATVTRNKDGSLAAQEVHIFPQAMRGSGEGLYPIAPGAPRLVIDAAVTATASGRLAVKFRGAGGNPCTGRAPVGAKAAGGCNGTASVLVPADTPVIALEPADRSDLKPEAVVALSVMAGPDGRPVTPGLTIETVALAGRTSSAAPSKRPN